MGAGLFTLCATARLEGSRVQRVFPSGESFPTQRERVARPRGGHRDSTQCDVHHSRHGLVAPKVSPLGLMPCCRFSAPRTTCTRPSDQSFWGLVIQGSGSAAALHVQVRSNGHDLLEYRKRFFFPRYCHFFPQTGKVSIKIQNGPKPWIKNMVVVHANTNTR